MRDFFNVGVAAFAFYFCMDAGVEDIFINVKKPKSALFVNPAEPGILVA